MTHPGLVSRLVPRFVASRLWQIRNTLNAKWLVPLDVTHADVVG
jgi:hypothetical protein